MKIRLKFLIFLGAFLTGAFLIVTWKSHNVFSKQFVEVSQQKEIEVLDQMGFYLSQRLKLTETFFQMENPSPQQLSQSHIKLLAHVLNEGGKWKAQWHEGQSGIRALAHTLTKQIPFESLSVVRPTWHFVNYKEYGQGVAYIIPGKSKDKMEFYALFFDFTFFKEALITGASSDTYAAVSPFAGEIYSIGKDVHFSEFIESNKKNLAQKQNGFLPLDKHKYVSYVFNPDIQLYLIKTASAPLLSVPKTSIMAVLGLLAFFLLVIALVAQDLLLKTVFQRVDDAVAIMKRLQDGESVEEEFRPINDELLALEKMSRYVSKVPEKTEVIKSTVVPKAPDKQDPVISDKTKSMVINSLGYVQKIKQDPDKSASYLTLLEAELRDLRRSLDPISVVFDPFKAAASAGVVEDAPPAKGDSSIESFIKEFKSKTTPAATIVDVPLDASLEIRKPKREVHGSKDV